MKLFICAFGLLLVAGCGDGNRQDGGSAKGFPVRVAHQNGNALPVRLDAETNIPVEIRSSTSALPVQLQINPRDGLPVELLLDDGRFLPVRLTTDANTVLTVDAMLKPQSSLPVEIQKSAEPLAVQFGIPQLPRQALIALGIIGGASILTALLSVVALVFACLALRRSIHDVASSRTGGSAKV